MSPDALVLLESMPAQHRASHKAAAGPSRVWGVYPHNGACRYVLPRQEAEEIVAADADGYDHIVRPATPADITHYGTDDRPEGWAP